MRMIKDFLKRRLSNSVQDESQIISSHDRFKGKVFCVGFNKTGTTSIEKVLNDFGYNMANQARAEMLTKECLDHGDYNRLVRLCHLHDAFQDAPFSFKEVYKVLDREFPNSKFILTIRNSGEEWFSSFLRFQTKAFSPDENQPSIEDLKNSPYGYKGMAYDNYVRLFDYPNIELYDKKKYIEAYESRNKEIIEYFKDRGDDLLILDVSKPNAYQRIASFLGVAVKPEAQFPWMNKT